MLSDYILPVNIGNPNEISLRDFADEVLALAGNKVKIVYRSLPEDDPKQRRPDITLAKKLLNWDPVVSRKEGLEKTYSYFKGLPQEEWYKLPREFASSR